MNFKKNLFLILLFSISFAGITHAMEQQELDKGKDLDAAVKALGKRMESLKGKLLFEQFLFNMFNDKDEEDTGIKKAIKAIVEGYEPKFIKLSDLFAYSAYYGASDLLKYIWENKNRNGFLKFQNHNIGDYYFFLSVKVPLEGCKCFMSIKNYSFTLMHLAALKKHLDVIKFLVNKGAVENVNKKNFNLGCKCKRGWTSLHSVFWVNENNNENKVENRNKMVEIANFLLEKGSKTNIEDMNGKTAIDYAKEVNITYNEDLKSFS